MQKHSITCTCQSKRIINIWPNAKRLPDSQQFLVKAVIKSMVTRHVLVLAILTHTQLIGQIVPQRFALITYARFVSKIRACLMTINAQVVLKMLYTFLKKWEIASVIKVSSFNHPQNLARPVIPTVCHALAAPIKSVIHVLTENTISEIIHVSQIVACLVTDTFIMHLVTHVSNVWSISTL